LAGPGKISKRIVTKQIFIKLKERSMSKENNKSTDAIKYATKEDIKNINESIEKLRKELDEVKWTLSLFDRLESLGTKDDKARSHLDENSDPIVDARIRLSLRVPPPAGVDFNKLTPFQFLTLAVDNAKAAVMEEVLPVYRQKIDEVSRATSDILAILELQDLEKKYSDFQEYRDDTRNILETTTTPITIEQAYLQAKAKRGKK
jgi:hypothetical protein